MGGWTEYIYLHWIWEKPQKKKQKSIGRGNDYLEKHIGGWTKMYVLC